MKKEEAKYISDFLKWIDKNMTPASVDFETYSNCYANSISVLDDVVNGLSTSDEALPIAGVDSRREQLSYCNHAYQFNNPDSIFDTNRTCVLCGDKIT